MVGVGLLTHRRRDRALATSSFSGTAPQILMALGAEGLVCAISATPSDLSHGDGRVACCCNDDLPESSPGEELRDAWTADERPVELPSGDEELAREPDWIHPVIPVVQVD